MSARQRPGFQEQCRTCGLWWQSVQMLGKHARGCVGNVDIPDEADVSAPMCTEASRAAPQQAGANEAAASSATSASASAAATSALPPAAATGALDEDPRSGHALGAEDVRLQPQHHQPPPPPTTTRAAARQGGALADEQAREEVAEEAPAGGELVRFRARQRKARVDGAAAGYRSRVHALSNPRLVRLHPLRRADGNWINLRWLLRSASMSEARYDDLLADVRADFLPKPARGSLLVRSRKEADAWARNYARDLGVALQPAKLLVDNGKGGAEHVQVTLQAAVASWTGLTRFASENPFYFNEQRVGGGGADGGVGFGADGGADPLLREVRTRGATIDAMVATTGGQRAVDHATSSDAYVLALREQRLRRVHLKSAWGLFGWIVFMDKVAEPDGEGFQHCLAVPAHLPIDEQSKPRAWLSVMISEVLKFSSPAISALPKHVALRAACEAKWSDVTVGALLRCCDGGVTVDRKSL